MSTPISVPNEYAIPCSEGFVVSDASWSAYVTSIPAQWLYELYQIHKTNLFPAYVRDNLAVNTSDKAANENIKQAAADDARNLWVYSNGITCLVNDFMAMTWGKKQINVRGIAIINGIQTAMAIGNMKYPPDEKAKIQVRFVKCANEETEQRIMSYNNGHDKMPVADIRKTEVMQGRLLK
jgi:hypothetical protein